MTSPGNMAGAPKSSYCAWQGIFRTPTTHVQVCCHKKKNQTPWPLVRERTIPTDRPPLVDEI
jgi:hypothetical protein